MFCHRQGAQGGVEGAGGPCAVGGYRCVGGVECAASRGKQRRGLLRIVLEGREHLRRVQGRDGGKLSLRTFEVRELFGEAFACFADALGEGRLFGAFGRKRRLDGAERVHVGPQVGHDGGGQSQLLGGYRRRVHLGLCAETAGDSRLTDVDRLGETIGGTEAELGTSEVQFVGCRPDLFIGSQELAVRLLDRMCRGLGVDLRRLLRDDPVALRRA